MWDTIFINEQKNRNYIYIVIRDKVLYFMENQELFNTHASMGRRIFLQKMCTKNISILFVIFCMCDIELIFAI